MIAVHDPGLRPKGVQKPKSLWVFKVWLLTEVFYDSSKSYRTGVLFWVIKLLILIFRVSNNFK